MLVRWGVVVSTATALSAASPWSSLPLKRKDEGQSRQSLPDFDAFHHMFVALSDMQDAYFQRWLGTWPQGIDWTRAVINTHVAAALRTVSTELELSRPDQGVECATRKEELIAGYFADIVAYYFGEDAFSLRNQAYDDMLWVVLGWLESIQFSDEHGRFLSSMAPVGAGITTTTTTHTAAPGSETWYGSRWTPAFAHRARIFWELAAKGWDTSLCGGGMLWNPRLMPYKNAITNQLFISASISMYLHFPGDANTSPFSTPTQASASHASPKHQPWRPHDPVFARAAQRAHAWLAASNMTNAQGLYADGFHISGHNDSGDGNNNTRCDTRDEMVYTYNQGVLLSGLLGLFRATRREAYLREGHALIKNVVRATGWDLHTNQPVDENNTKGGLPPWRGLGRWGVLEEACDVAGTCSQDAQTFKGVWMHHFAAFCGAGALSSVPSSSSSDRGDDNNEEEGEMGRVRAWHAGECRRYVPWLRRNARAAMGTKDERGLFGMWWTPGLLAAVTREEVEVEMEKGGDDGFDSGEVVDYRNRGVPQTEMWVRVADLPQPLHARPPPAGQKPLGVVGSSSGSGGGGLATDSEARPPPPRPPPPPLVGKRGGETPNKDKTTASAQWDPNLRGRGRTVETQGGGLAVLRALWVVSRHEL